MSLVQIPPVVKAAAQIMLGNLLGVVLSVVVAKGVVTGISVVVSGAAGIHGPVMTVSIRRVSELGPLLASVAPHPEAFF